MNAIPVLLAGTVGSGAQDHQAHMWAPALEAAGLAAAGVWTPPTVGDAAIARARALAGSLGLEAEVSDEPGTDAAAAIVCLRGRERLAFARFAAARGIPILIDKPTLDSTAELEELAAAAGTVVPGHHLAVHPGYTRVLRAVRNAEFGLLRAVHADLVTGGGEASPDGELRNLGVYLVELIRRATGPATVTLQAHATPAGDAWSFLGKTDRAIVVSAHVSRASAGDGAARTLRAKVRLIGTHGSTLLDLTGPALSVMTTAGASELPFAGESSVVAQLKALAALTRGGSAAPASDLVTLSRALDAIADSAAGGAAATLTW